jgi:hypothetical protein
MLERLMMKKTAIAAAVIIVMLLSGNLTKAGVSVIVNGTFEKDGWISNITEENTPHGWPDVNLPEKKFVAWVENDWSTYVDYGYSLTLCTNANQTVEIGDMAMVSQEVYLEDVNEIIFDVKLGTEYSYIPWDSQKRSAVLLIDDDIVWDSDVLGVGANGEYRDITIDVNELYGAGLHKLSLAIRIDAVETSYWQYWAQWDFIRFDTHCEGFGYLRADLNYDCYVDWPDLKILAEQWLEEPSDERYDLFAGDENIIDLYDFSVLAESWMDSSYWQPDQLLDMDRNNDGIVNFIDFAFLAKDWELESVDYDDINKLAEQWLETNWIYELW